MVGSSMMRHKLAIGALALALLLMQTRPAHGVLALGANAPSFSKTELDAPAPATRTLASWPNKVIVFFLFGWT
jgi:hypothetical protein